MVERWRAARTAYEEEAEGADADPAKQATRREAEVARWRERAARGEARDVAGNANLAPVAGDWRERAAAARLRRERLQAVADVEHTETHETHETDRTLTLLPKSQNFSRKLFILTVVRR